MARQPKSIAGKGIQKFTKFTKALDKRNKNWLHELGNQVLKEADKLVPNTSGQLRNSQKVEYTKDGFKIIVDTPYAYALHEGKKQERNKQGIYKSKVREHWRDIGGPDLIKIREHTKTYKKGYKPMKMPDGDWATINVNKKPKKQAWLQEAWKIVRRQQDPITRKLLQRSLYIEK